MVAFSSYYELTEIPSDIPYRLMEQTNGGLCHHLALNATQMLRAIGIPLQYDMIPFHGKINGGHAYSSFTKTDGRFYFFSPYEREPERKKIDSTFSIEKYLYIKAFYITSPPHLSKRSFVFSLT